MGLLKYLTALFFTGSIAQAAYFPVNNNERTVTGNITAACVITSGVASSCAAGSTVQVSSVGTATVQYGTSGTWVATITQDISYDPACATTPNTSIWFNQGTFDTDATTNAFLYSFQAANNNDPWIILTPSTQCTRIRASAYTSGTVVVQIASGQGSVSNIPLAVYNSIFPAPTSGNLVQLQTNRFGELAVASRNKFLNIHGAVAANTVKSGGGKLHAICLNNPTSSGVITIWDNTTNSGTLIATITQGAGTSQVPNCVLYDLEFSTGLTVTTTVATNDITISYQ